MNKVELLAPAGDIERANYALEYGADAIYLGGKQFSLRARASNFDFKDIQKVVNAAHEKNKKVYLVANVLCHNYLLNDFTAFFNQVSKMGIDGFIVADPFIIYQLKKNYPHCEVHISTQQSITNSKAAAFWKRMGATRVVLARELHLQELQLISHNNNHLVELEVFIHGAVCIAYSGRCMMSNNFSLRDANVGGCAQSCRWAYEVLDSNSQHFFTMSAKDMVYLKHLKELLDLDISSFKIEGRMKTINYLTTVVKTYRAAIDSIVNQTENKFSDWEKELEHVANRPTDDAFLINADAKHMLYHDEEKKLVQDFVFTINAKKAPCIFEITSKNYFDLNMKFQIIQPNGPNIKIKIAKITDIDGNSIITVNTPMTKCIIELTADYDFNNFCIGKIIYE